MTSQQQQQPIYCKWCGRVEITFSDNFKSKSGKYIPIEKSSGIPHKCTANPNPYQQRQNGQQQTQQQQAQQVESVPKMTLEILYSKLDEVSSKVDRLLNLAERK